MNNKTLSQFNLPPLAEFVPEKIQLTINQILQNNRQQLTQLLQQKSFNWNNLIQPLDDSDDHLQEWWSLIGQMNAVINSPSLREAYNACLPIITEYHTELSQNEHLYNAIKNITERPDFSQLNSVQQKILRDELRDFHLAGVDLPLEKKARFAELEKQLSERSNKFEENLLDATQGWQRLIENPDELAGIPEHAVQTAKENAQRKNLNGWLFTLDMPSYYAVMSYADSRALREEMYSAYSTRASDQGPTAGKWDNTPVMYDILKLRLEIAKLLDFNNFAELSLATKTAKNVPEVLDFLNDLLQYSKPLAKREFAELQTFAKQNYGIDEIKPWDAPYFSEKLSQQKFSFSEEELRPYFPEPQVLSGMFAVVEKLFGIKVKQQPGVETWHPDVHFFVVHDEQQNLIGGFYIDLYARENKRGGAWMGEWRSRRRLNDGKTQLPVAFLTCNFARPVGNKLALFTHQDVVTLFHEFGHTLHQLLTKVDYSAASGINNVPWDVVEVPSQFLENWCWQKESLQLIARHYQTQAPLPDHLLNQLLASKTFQAGIHSLRQLEFALFDFHLHAEFNPEQAQQIQTVLQSVREQTALYPVPAYNRFPNSFAHIFGSSYAAGYYSYKWAEVWSSDAFAKFEEEGIFNRHTGQAFLQNILEKGSAEDPLQMFIAFRGRAPRIEALLRHMGADVAEKFDFQE